MNKLALPRVIVWIATVLGLGLAILLGRYAGQGNAKQIFLIFGFCFAVALFLFLGKNYWLLLIFSFSSSLPALPFGGKTMELGELMGVACFVTYLVMVVFRKNNLRLITSDSLVLTALMAWIGIIYFLNPVGLAIFGAESVGVRGYFRILIGYLSFLVISNQNISERDVKWLLVIFVIGPFLALGWSFVDMTFLGGNGMGATEAAEVSENEYTWHQALSGPAFAVSLFAFCKYGSRKIFSFNHPGLALLYVGCLVVALISGKRAVFATTLLVPVVVGLVRREWDRVFVIGFFLALGLGILVMGHGTWFELPYRAQRAMANLPGDWDPEVKSMTEGGGDSFRALMRELAWKRIEEHPIVGKGLGFSWQDVAGINPENYLQNINVALALGNSWHNTWLGLWADFGLPSVILYGIALLLYGWNLWRAYKLSSSESNIRILTLMLFVGFWFMLLRSYTSGSSNVLYTTGMYFGLGYALLNSLKNSNQKNGEVEATKEQDVMLKPQDTEVAKMESGL